MAPDETNVESLNQRLHDQAVEEFKNLHGTVFSEISSLLRLAKLAPLLELRKQDPTFSSVVQELKTYREVYVRLATIFEVDKAAEIVAIDEYINLADDLAKAIDADDADALCGAIAALDVQPYI